MMTTDFVYKSGKGFDRNTVGELKDLTNGQPSFRIDLNTRLKTAPKVLKLIEDWLLFQSLRYFK